MTWPPLSLPSHISSIIDRGVYILDLLVLTISYIYLLGLAFFYYGTGLTKRGSSTFMGVNGVADETMKSFCDRHWIGKKIRNEVLEPLYAAVSTVGREEVELLPVAELLD